MDWITVRGNSMRPFLRDGDQVGVEWLAPNRSHAADHRPRVGEIILARAADGDWLVHRIVPRVDSLELASKGDASFAWDDLDHDDLWGRVASVKRQGETMGRPVNVTSLDRAIAKASAAAMSRSRLRAALCRRIVFVLSNLRRMTL